MKNKHNKNSNHHTHASIQVNREMRLQEEFTKLLKFLSILNQQRLRKTCKQNKHHIHSTHTHTHTTHTYTHTLSLSHMHTHTHTHQTKKRSPTYSADQNERRSELTGRVHWDWTGQPLEQGCPTPQRVVLGHTTAVTQHLHQTTVKLKPGSELYISPHMQYCSQLFHVPFLRHGVGQYYVWLLVTESGTVFSRLALNQLFLLDYFHGSFTKKIGRLTNIIAQVFLYLFLNLCSVMGQKILNTR